MPSQEHYKIAELELKASRLRSLRRAINSAIEVSDELNSTNPKKRLIRAIPGKRKFLESKLDFYAGCADELANEVDIIDLIKEIPTNLTPNSCPGYLGELLQVRELTALAFEIMEIEELKGNPKLNVQDYQNELIEGFSQEITAITI